MANRFLVGSGNWSNTAIWSATSNGAGGASVPTTGDYVYMTTSTAYTLTMDMDVTVYYFYTSYQFPGTINMGSYTHVFNTIQFDGGTFNLDSSNITITSSFTRGQSGGTVTMNPGSSVVTMTANGGSINGLTGLPLQFATLILANNTVMSNLTVETLINKRAGLSPANIMYITNGKDISVRRFISNGAGAYKATVRNSSDGGAVSTINMLSSNQMLALSNVIVKNISFVGSGAYYAQDSSTDSGGNTNISFSQAPKVESLVDPFTGGTISTTRWTTTGTGLSQSGGQLVFTSTSGITTAGIISKDQFLAEGSSLRVKTNLTAGSLTIVLANATLQYGVTARRNIPDIYLTLTPTQGRFYINAHTGYASSYFTNSYSYYRIREASGTLYVDGSTDGVGYTNVVSVVASTYGLDTTQLIARPILNFFGDGVATITVDDLNVDLEPTAQFTSSATSGNTPLSITFTDQSNFTPTTWSWNFGDSTTSTLQNPSKTYSAPGTYTVSLTSSNSSYSRSITKTNLVTVSPNVYSRSVSGILIFSGSVSRKILASRSISGTLKFGGNVRGVLLRDVEGLQGKRYLYKIYDEDGTYIETWGKKVISELTFTDEINEVGSSTEVELAVNSDTVAVSDSNLLTEDELILLTEDDLTLLATTEAMNQIGEGTSINYNNRVDIYVFYGSVEPLLTEAEEPILTEGDDELFADVGAPNGRRIFTGFIADINSRYGNTETTVVKLVSYGWDLDQYPLTNVEGDTTVTFNSYDPSDIAKEALDRFVIDSSMEGTYTTKTVTSINDTGTTVSYTFRSDSYKTVLEKVLELMPSDWYFRVDLGENVVYFDERSIIPDHLFYLGKHIEGLDLKGSIIGSTNRVLYTGGGDPALYVDRSATPAPRTRRKLEVISDARVTLQDSAEIISDGKIQQNNKILYRTTVEILSEQYDTETINPGDSVGFRNFGNDVDGLVLQVVGRSYTPDAVQLQLETKPPTINKRLEDIRRNLIVTDNTNLPDAPS